MALANLDEVTITFPLFFAQGLCIKSFCKLLVEFSSLLFKPGHKELLQKLQLPDPQLLYFDFFLLHAYLLQIVCLIKNRLFKTTLGRRFLSNLH